MAYAAINNPTCDADGTRRGWTEAVIEAGTRSLHVSYHPDADLDGPFKAFCHDDQEMIVLKGWLIDDITAIADWQEG